MKPIATTFFRSKGKLLTVKDSHDNLVVGASVYKNDVLQGLTDVNGEFKSSDEAGVIYVVGFSGFLIKEHILTSASNQDVVLSYPFTTVQIGTQIWQGANLALDDKQGGNVYPDDDILNVPDYGLLYNNAMVARLSNLYPNFFSPSEAEGDVLFAYLGGKITSGGKLKETGLTHWNSPNTGATDETSFSARAAGFYHSGTTYQDFKDFALFKFSTGVLYSLYTNDIEIRKHPTAVYVNSSSSLRLLKTTGDTFIFSISVNNGSSAISGATVTVEGTPYITDSDGKVIITEFKTSVNYTVEKTNFVTVNGSIDLTTDLIEIVTMVVLGLGNGYLYNWYAASDVNFAPTDWSVPTGSEYAIFGAYVGGFFQLNVSNKLKEVGIVSWESPNTGATDEYGFTLKGSGYRNGSDGVFGGLTTFTYLWSFTGGIIDVRSTDTYLRWYGSSENRSGYSIRLLYTGAGTPGATITDYDGNSYDVVQVGTQYWTVQNWKCTKLNNGTSIPNVTDGTAWGNLTTLGRCAYDNDEGNV